ncbi:MAG: PD-(D/E)XK nuclease family protein, partial [Actinomycetota bacterium]
LAAFLDEVHAFSPLEGELTLRAFLDYVDTVEAGEKQEWSPVQPSDEDSVKVMTIHQAKGLEFDTVFVPGLAHEVLPDDRVQHNPAEKGKSLDFELRGDAAVLPTLDQHKGVLKHFWRALKEQQTIEERRACYVALTRAKRRLFVTGAHWYGEGESAKRPSAFFDELAQWGEETGQAVVDRGPDPGDANPLVGYRQRFVRDWPGPARRDDSDPLFPEGWRKAAVTAATLGGVQERLLEGLEGSDRDTYRRLSGERRSLAAHLLERERTGSRQTVLPLTVAVGGVMDYARCPKRFYWSSVRPLPRFSGPAARIGTQIHAWIERRSSGQASLLELEETPDLTVEELAGEPGRIDRLQRAFQDSRFADRIPLYAERPFLLHVDGFTVSGRIDAIFGTPDGPWEIVDYKTGRPPGSDDDVSGLQLDIYALAATEVWGKDPNDVTLTYLYLATGEEDSRPAGDPELVRKRVHQTLLAMAEGSFEPTPGPQCRWCDFLSFCDAGKRHVAAAEPGA